MDLINKLKKDFNYNYKNNNIIINKKNNNINIIINKNNKINIKCTQGTMIFDGEEISYSEIMDKIDQIINNY